MTAPGQQASAIPPGNKSPTPVTSPARSREPSPARQLLSPPLVQPNDPRLRPNTDALAQTRLSSSVAAASNGNIRPRPLSLNEAANRLAKSETQENGAVNGSSGMRWPTSPRLRSPPSSINPGRNSSSSTRQSDGEGAEPEPAQQANRSLSVPVDVGPKSSAVAPIAASGSKGPRGFSGLTSTLETVQEGDQSSSPSTTEKAIVNAERPGPVEKQPPDNSRINGSPERPAGDGTADTAEAEAEAAKNKEALKSPGQGPINGKKMAPPMVSAKVRPNTEGSSKNMIVETETVASIPQSAAGANNGERNGNTKRDETGTLRANPSMETMKSKKEKKKAVPKRTPTNSGQASSKADIFEAKVTSAAEDNESDSDETFIYESNPPESKSRPHRHHSRTPSATSTRSVTDRKAGSRNLGNISDGQRGVRTKRSMKFASNSYAADDESGDRDQGTVRAHRKKNGSDSAHQMHGFSNDSHQQTGEDESPFSQASKLRNAKNGATPRSPSKVHTPKSGSPPPYSQTPTKGDQASSYDFDNGRSFSEQEPLLGSLRTPRTRPSRSSNLRHMDYYNSGRHRQRGYARRCAGVFVVMMIVILVLMIAAGFLFATTHPLVGVELLDIENILATEESLMVDLKCTAINPNIVPISIANMDVNIFAKSTHVTPEDPQHATSSDQQQHHRHSRPRSSRSRARSPQADDSTALHSLDSVDDGTDPINDPTTMLLGRIFHFDSALSFDASPLRRLPQNATGSLRLEKPGNATEEDGSERWERIIQFPFELTVRGVLKYTLPLSSRIVTCSVRKTVQVDPDDADDDDGDGGVFRVRSVSSGREVSVGARQGPRDNG